MNSIVSLPAGKADFPENMDQDFLKKLFQHEFVKMVAVISKRFGLQHIEIAEDIVADTFLAATETWKTKGIPEHPAAWLYAVARQKTLYHFRRNKIYEDKVLPQIPLPEDDEEWDFSESHIKDSQLQMLFAICNPIIASEAQIGLALRILCGFGIDEIADAFLTNKSTVNKRLFRAKEKLRTEKVAMELPPEHEIIQRLDNVLHVIYLLFNEGYYSRTQDEIIRKDLCLEAVRLGALLTDSPLTARPKTYALLALMCFHASRLVARQSHQAGMILYEEQDEALWDKDLIRHGNYFLDLSIGGDELSSYHLEAQIAFWHCIKADVPEKWERILQAYNQLLLVNYSPAVALNRTYALYKADGWEIALPEAEKLQLESNHFYFVLLGELYTHCDPAKAQQHFQQAHALAKTPAERAFIQTKLKC